MIGWLCFLAYVGIQYQDLKKQIVPHIKNI